MLFDSPLFPLLIHSLQLPPPSDGRDSDPGDPAKLTQRPPFARVAIPNGSALYLSPWFVQALSAKSSPHSPRPEKAFQPVVVRSPAPSKPIGHRSYKVPPLQASSPLPCPASLVFIPPVTRGCGKPKSGRGEVEGGKGGGKGRKVKGIERLSFPRLVRFSTAPSSRCIVGSRRRAGDAQIRRGAYSLAPPVVRKAALPFLGT